MRGSYALAADWKASIACWRFVPSTDWHAGVVHSSRWRSSRRNVLIDARRLARSITEGRPLSLTYALLAAMFRKVKNV
jgi:hypothetical protein